MTPEREAEIRAIKPFPCADWAESLLESARVDLLGEVDALRECLRNLADDNWPFTSVRHQEETLKQAKELLK